MCKPNIKNIKNILSFHVSVISPWQWKQYQSCLSYGSMSSATNIVRYLPNSISRLFLISFSFILQQILSHIFETFYLAYF